MLGKKTPQDNFVLSRKLPLVKRGGRIAAKTVYLDGLLEIYKVGGFLQELPLLMIRISKMGEQSYPLNNMSDF